MKNFYPIVATLVLLALIAIPLTGCVKVVYETPPPETPSSTSSQQASLSEATICKSVDSTTKQPIERADVFPPDFDKIYCSVKYSNAPPHTEVGAQWFDNNNQKLIDQAVTTEGTGYIAFSVERAQEAPFTTGNYVVKLFLDGTEQLTVPFKLQASTAITEQPSGISLPNTFQEPRLGYAINYPADWTYETYEASGRVRVKFYSKKGLETSGTLGIQNVTSTKVGGKYEDVDAVINELINQIKAADANADVYCETVTAPNAQGQQVTGKVCGIEYTYEGQKYKQLLTVVPHSVNGETFHVLSYDALADIFDTNLPTVTAMLSSFSTLKNTQ